MNSALDQQKQVLTKRFRTSEGTVVIELRGARVLTIEGLPEGTRVESIFKLLR